MSHAEINTLKFAFENSLKKYSERPAVVFEGETYTYGEVDAKSNALANALVERGVEPEDRVATVMSNRFEFVIARLAIIKAGAAVMPINPDLSTEEIKYMLSVPEVAYAICGEDGVSHLEAVDAASDHLECVIVAASQSDERPSYFERYSEVLADSEALEPPAVPVEEDDIAGHHYTGGTTGKPKGVLFSERSRLRNLYANIIELDINSTDTLLLTTPVAHASRVFLKAALLAGATVILRKGFDAESALKDIREHDISWTFMVPTMIHRILERVERADSMLDSLETFVYGAAPISPSDLREAVDVFGPIFIQLYGQTEVPNLISTLGKAEHQLGLETDETLLQSAGQPCLMADVKIVDTNTGERQAVGEIGEIVAKAPYTMERYFELPEKTEETMENGWVHTGDIGRRDEEGYLYLLDRKSDMIITGGLNVYSVEVEDVLASHPQIDNVAVIGIPHDEWGEAIKAFIVPGSTAQADDSLEEDIFEFAAENLSAYKKPKTIEFVDDLPKTEYGKIDKKALRDKHWEGERNIN